MNTMDQLLNRTLQLMAKAMLRQSIKVQPVKGVR
jgi:hypothetical protein